jgi:hypothetical protein
VNARLAKHGQTADRAADEKELSTFSAPSSCSLPTATSVPADAVVSEGGPVPSTQPSFSAIRGNVRYPQTEKSMTTRGAQTLSREQLRITRPGTVPPRTAHGFIACLHHQMLT